MLATLQSIQPGAASVLAVAFAVTAVVVAVLVRRLVGINRRLKELHEHLADSEARLRRTLQQRDPPNTEEGPGGAPAAE